MILVIGGAGSGKGAFVREVLGVPERDIARGALDGRPCVADAHELLRPGADVPGAAQGWEALVGPLGAKAVVTCDEVGCDLIPLDAGLAGWRESVGRLCCALAARATCVVRMTCGIPQAIKGELPRRAAGAGRP